MGKQPRARSFGAFSPVPVSVIIPCFNCSETLGLAVQSVLEQSVYPAELVLVDDASEDGTLQLAERIEAAVKVPHVKVVSHEANVGPGSARNTGWNHASSPYVAFLDADDVWHPRKLEIQYKWMRLHPDVVLTGHRMVRAEKESPWYSVSDEWDATRLKKWQLLLSNPFSTPTVMVRTDLDHRFPPGKSYSEDYRLWLEIGLSNNAIWRLELPLARMHKHAYGEKGLSKELWRMELGALDAYRTLHRERLISSPLAALLMAYSFAKHIRRVIKRRG